MSELLILWITFSGLAVAAVAVMLVWAARTKQFSQQDRARYLALTSGIPKANSGAGVPPAESLLAADGTSASGPVPPKTDVPSAANGKTDKTNV